MPVKRMVSKIPDSVERPSAEVMNQMVTHLYKDELSRVTKVNQRKQRKQQKIKLREL